MLLESSAPVAHGRGAGIPAIGGQAFGTGRACDREELVRVHDAHILADKRSPVKVQNALNLRPRLPRCCRPRRTSGIANRVGRLRFRLFCGHSDGAPARGFQGTAALAMVFRSNLRYTCVLHICPRTPVSSRKKSRKALFRRQLRRLHGAMVEIVGVMNRPQLDGALIEEADIPLDRALFPLPVGIERSGPIGVVDLGRPRGARPHHRQPSGRQARKSRSGGAVARRAPDAASGRAPSERRRHRY